MQALGFRVMQLAQFLVTMPVAAESCQHADAVLLCFPGKACLSLLLSMCLCSTGHRGTGCTQVVTEGRPAHSLSAALNSTPQVPQLHSIEWKL
jgi:hypothetical protein